jgi:hypothetical protein
MCELNQRFRPIFWLLLYTPIGSQGCRKFQGRLTSWGLTAKKPYCRACWTVSAFPTWCGAETNHCSSRAHARIAHAQERHCFQPPRSGQRADPPSLALVTALIHDLAGAGIQHESRDTDALREMCPSPSAALGAPASMAFCFFSRSMRISTLFLKQSKHSCAFST